ncbi:MAG: hypothetical protein ABEJ07_02400 [Candidatus Nanohaloarchaea archaeon]
MPEKEIAEILLNADSRFLSIREIRKELSSDPTQDMVARDVERIARKAGTEYREWLWNNGKYDLSAVHEYEETIRKGYGLEYIPEPVREELEDLGL